MPQAYTKPATVETYLYVPVSTSPVPPVGQKSHLPRKPGDFDRETASGMGILLAMLCILLWCLHLDGSQGWLRIRGFRA